MLNILRLLIYSALCCRQLKVHLPDSNNDLQWNTFSNTEIFLEQCEKARIFQSTFTLSASLEVKHPVLGNRASNLEACELENIIVDS